MKSNKIVIGTRGSELALVQSTIVAEALKAAHPGITVDIRAIVTQGDVDQRPIPSDVNGKGWFTKEIEQELLAGSIDIAVHSLKDMGEHQPEGLGIAAYLPREDARDALITRSGESLEMLPQSALVGTDSPRRKAQMLALRSDLRVISLRGNVPTRLKKLDGEFAGAERGPTAEKYDAIVLAVAGLKRLGLEKRIVRIFESHEMTPAPGQGILAIQARENDDSVQQILAGINDRETEQIANVERSFARAAGAGCKSPTGAYAARVGSSCRLVAMIGKEDGSNMVRGESVMPWESSEGMGETLAKELLAKLQK